MTPTEEELTAAVSWLISVNDPDIAQAVLLTQQGLGLTIVEWAREAPDEVMEFYEACCMLANQAPLEDTQMFVTDRSIIVNDREPRR